ncbi:MAG: energy-coupling factor transporter ATPase [Clostridia bacterium]|nr:energy-coupling factor transporter ATPase [Clostridia bacterium]MBQ2092710.1 energy-coupling factor transporter ATPase [Clostridia bacterium]
MESILKFDDVYFSYDEETDETQGEVHWAVSALSLEVKRGDFIAVLGHNGSGKSTLAKLSNAILIPDKGEVTVKGISTKDEDRTLEIRRHVGMVFQNPDNQIVATVVEEDVAFGPENLGLEPAEIRERVDDALKAVGMYEFRENEPHNLSGGQKQRVAIAGILAMRPECIVLDESTAMLDPKGRREVLETVRKLHDEFGMAVVFITHYMDEAAMADRVIVMEQGKVLFDGAPCDVFQNVDELRRVGLDVPQATELALSLGLPGKILTLSECTDAIINSLK